MRTELGGRGRGNASLGRNWRTRQRAAAQAKRLAADTPRLAANVQHARTDVERAREMLTGREEELDVVRYAAVVAQEQDESRDLAQQPRPTIAEKMGIDGLKLALLIVVEVVAALLQLDEPISKTVQTTFPCEPALIALSLALCLHLLAFMAGRLIAAIELPQRFVAFLFLLLVGYVLCQLPDVDLMRKGPSAGGTASLTWVSLTVATVASATGWTSALHADFQRRLVAFLSPGSRKRLWDEKIASAETKVAVGRDELKNAKERLSDAKESLKTHQVKISALLEVVDGDPLIRKEAGRHRSAPHSRNGIFR